jgi:cell division septal protein FtsQ
MNPKVLLKETPQNFFSERKKEQESLDFWFNTTYLFLLWLIGGLLIYYVWILNVNATQWYNVRQIEMERRNLEAQLNLIQAKIADLESLSTIMKDDDLKDMEKVENPDYLVIRDGVQYVYNNAK